MLGAVCLLSDRLIGNRKESDGPTLRNIMIPKTNGVAGVASYDTDSGKSASSIGTENFSSCQFSFSPDGTFRTCGPRLQPTTTSQYLVLT